MEATKQFIKAQVLDIKRRPHASPANPLDCLTVEKVAPFSIAGALRLRPGDVLEAIDGVPAAEVDLDRFHPIKDQVAYRFFQPRQRQSLRVKTRACPLGMTCKADPAVLRARCVLEVDPLDSLFKLWQAQAWSDLKAATAPFVPRPQWGLGALWERLRPYADPSTLMSAVARWELGEHEAAMRQIMTYHKVEWRWTMNFMAVVRYYIAREMLRRGQSEADAAALLLQAFECSPEDQIADQVEQLIGFRPEDEKPWDGKKLELDYDLMEIDGRGIVSMRDELDRMQPHQVFILCLLTSYRGNGPYNDFMIRYHRMMATMSPLIAGLHVITTQPERRADRPHWYEAEDAARAASVPFSVLLDEEGDLDPVIAPDCSPFLMLVSKSRRVLCSRKFDEVDLWNALARCGNKRRGDGA